MLDILNILYVVAVVLLLFGAAIFVHEFGHFWVALKRGLVVEEFAIGFGPIIWSKEHEGILYSIRAIPAGGFVILPQMLRRGYEFEVAMAVGILGTIVAYGIGIWAAQSFGDIS